MNVEELKEQVRALQRARRFVRYQASFELAEQLRTLLTAIEERLLPAHPDMALTIAESLVRADSRVLGRVDDSAGVVGGAFRDACRLWLKAAAASSGLGSTSAADRVEALRTLAEDDDYGVREPLLQHASDLLSQHELRRLGAHYEREAEESPGAGDVGIADWDRSQACVRLGLVAEALRDAALYERSVKLYGREELNALQLTSVARRYLKYGHPGEAANRLEQARRLGGRGDLNLLARCYEQLGDRDRQIVCLWDYFRQDCSFSVLEELESLLPPEQRDSLRERALNVAVREPYVPSAVLCVLRLGHATEAEKLMLERFPDMGSRDADYRHLLSAAKLAAERGTPLTEALCYRRLLLDILEEARSTAYGHAARYLDRLDKLAALIRDYRTAPTHEAFLDLLRQQHGRKHAFWRRVANVDSDFA